MRYLFPAIAAAFLCASAGAQTVVVDLRSDKGPVKVLNAVNNGPTAADFSMYKFAEFPYARTHDANLSGEFGAPNTVDISAVFPVWEADACAESSYNFAETDKLLKSYVDAGTGVFYRLGEAIEHTVRKYDIYPPKDYKKWAVIAEHIIRHYNEGWADGFRWNIEYWEIWNEYESGNCWKGTIEQFYDFYEVAARHLKKQFPSLKIGGPATEWRYKNGQDTATPFIEEMARRKVPVDFLSWHRYCLSPELVAAHAVQMRQTLDKNGYGSTLSILNEWNTRPFDIAGTLAGACFAAATMANMQDKPVDMMMYYDARPGTVLNGLFDLYGKPLKAYWAFVSWSRLRRLGTSVAVSGDTAEIYATAAKDDKGNAGILVARFNPAPGAPEGKYYQKSVPVTISLPGVRAGNVSVQMVDSFYDFGNVPATVSETSAGSTVTIDMEFLSFAWIGLPGTGSLSDGSGNL